MRVMRISVDTARPNGELIGYLYKQNVMPVVFRCE